ncbi:MAG: DUF1538 domain-containing protein [Flavobacteriales bacterium]
MSLLFDMGRMFLSTLGDVAPIAVLIVFFQMVVLRQPIPKLKRVLIGSMYVVVGLSFFLIGLEKALFPLGNLMAAQLADPAFVGVDPEAPVDWTAYHWIYLFALMTGFATAIAEPSLIAVAFKAGEVSAGTIAPKGLRIAVAVGVGLALALGAFRIITGTPLHWYIMAGYAVVIVQTIFAPKPIIALAYDSGGVATSTVTVPIVVALGLGLSSAIPGRNPMLDGFGMIAIACMFPIIAVLAYAQVMHWLTLRKPQPKDP